MDFIKIKGVLITVMIFSLTLGEAWGVASFAQNVGINTTGNAPNSSALLDINASPGNNKGILIPRLPLTAANVGTPISPAPGAGETGLMVFNTATAGVPPNDVVPGFYYWNGTAWSPLGGGSGGAGGWTDDGTVVRLTTSTDFVGIGTASPAATSALDITSTTKGLLIPRMTTAQRDAIATPATGLQVYNTDCKMINYWSGTCWISMSKALPSPGAITSSGTTVFCAGQSRTYSIAAVPGATAYTWTVPAGTVITSGQGTTSIGATFGNISGSVCVDASNLCETSPVRCLGVSVDPIPNTPGNITGPSSVNPGQQSVNYFIASVNGASAYTWAYSGTGLTIASGTGTTSIVVNFACNATAGNLTVTANSTCGASTASSLALTVTPLLAVSAGAPVFGGTTQTIGNAATGGTVAYTYAWLPASNLSSYTIASPIAQCTGGTTTYTVTATDSRSCTATSTVLVTRDLAASAGGNLTGPGAIGGAPTATGGAGTYTYSWTTPSELSSSTVSNPTAKACSTTTFTVTVTDANSCTAASSGVTVTKNLAASAGANQNMVSGCSKNIGGSPTATGGAGAYTYSWSLGTGLSSTTIANPTTTATSTITYTVTVTDGNSCTATSSMTLTIGGTTVTFNNTSTGQSGTIQNWTVPAGITCINIETWGAQGGAGAAGAGGLGARMKGSFTVTPAQVLKIMVGQQGPSPGSNDGGGGGGTFVTDNANSPMIIAGGGGGGSYSAPGAGIAGTTANSGTAGANGGSGGAGGGGGTSVGCSGAGGGLTGNGGNGPACGSACNGGLSFVNGGTGGCTSSNCTGGYGGGGGTHGGGWGGGGGGGYSGGGASTSSQYGGGGGGSYNSGANPSNTGGVKVGHGQVVITY